MLYFKAEEIRVCKDKKPCALCRERVGVWTGKLLNGEEAHLCAHCLMYSGKTEWGYDNREELLHVGRAAQEQAAKHSKPLPMIDERGKLHPADAEKFIMGVSFTSRMVMDRMVRRRGLSD